ncbi:MAG: hypothetical protein PHQ36_07805 [Anaerolineales bacterium]|nr:hypothetical protein [Anaerolineales bacterium]
MGKYTKRAPEKYVEKDHTKSLAWRGIGCLLMIVVPALSIAGALLTINSSLAGYIPFEFMGYPVLPNYLFATPGLTAIFAPIANTQNLYAVIAISIVYTVMIGGVISLVYAVIYRIANPHRYGPLDAPPPKFKAKKYKR